MIETPPQVIETPTAVFQPFAWQIAPWRDKSPTLLLTGSAGGGKSIVASEKVHGYLLAYPGATGVGLRKAAEYSSKSIVPLMQHAIGDDPRVHVKTSMSRIDYDNGSVFYWGGMKDIHQREALRSMRGKLGDPDIIWMEEANAFSHDDFDEAGARVRGHAAPWTQLILTTNPDDPGHYIYTDLILGGQASVYYSNAHDNPTNTPAYFARLDGLTGVLRARLRDGKWVRAEGVVFDEYDSQVHLIDAFDIPRTWRRIRVVDFGYTNPFVCQWWALDNDDKAFRYREIYRTHRTVEEHAEDIKELSVGEKIETTVCDHDAEDAATLRRHGIPTTPAFKDITTGIQAVQKRLKEKRLFFFRGALVEEDPGLIEQKKPICTEGEFPGYIWPKTQDGRPIKEVPIKVNDHGMDTTRYFTVYVDKPKRRVGAW
jgi:phage terminase large subunit